MKTNPPLIFPLATLFIVALLASRLPPSHAQTTQPPLQRPRILDTSGKVASEFLFPPGQTKLVLKLASGADIWLTDKMKINGRPVGWMLIDTGANRTCLDPSVLAELDLKSHPANTLDDPYESYLVDRLDLAGFTLKNHYLGTFDLSAARRSFGILLAGSIGGDILGLTPFSLDFSQGTLTFYARSDFKPPANAREIPLQLFGTPTDNSSFSRANPALGSLAVIGQIAGLNCTIALDTGNTTALLLRPAFSRQHPEWFDLQTGNQSQSATVYGYSTLVQAHPQKLFLFGRTLNPPEMEAEITSSRDLHEHADYQAVAGMPLLQNERLTFDYAAGKMWVEDQPLPSIPSRLAAGMNPNTPDASHHTPLMLAAVHGDLPATNALLKAGANPDAQDAVGRTALFFAILYNHPDIAQILLSAYTGNINDQIANGETPLMVAMGHPAEVSLVKMLLQSGAKLSLTDSDDQETALHYAARESVDPAVIDLLIAHHADLNASNKRGRYPLDLALSRGKVQIAQALQNAGARLSHENNWTLLHYAASNPDPAMIQYALKDPQAHSLINAQSSDIRATALMFAAAAGNTEAVRALLAAGANPNLIANENNTALTVAANNPEIIKLLQTALAQPHPATHPTP